MINSIMFHYFYDIKKYKKVQGSISVQDLNDIITKSKYHILSFDEWCYKYENNILKEHEVFISFDDALKEQIDIALPILNKYNLKALFSINTYPIENGYDKLEVYRYFRNNFFDDTDTFYVEFFNEILKSSIRKQFLEICDKVDFNNYLGQFKFYTYNDKKFRYIRDKFLKENYFKIMDNMIKKYKLDLSNINLWFTKNDICNLVRDNHFISLHTHNHPTQLSSLDFIVQKNEILYNKKYLENIINKDIKYICYPCGDYNSDTISILKEFGIKYGFVSFPNKNENRFTLGRVDCVDVLKELRVYN